MKQIIITPLINNCFCGSVAKIQTWENYDIIYQVICENRHTLTKYCKTRHRATCLWNNRILKTMDKITDKILKNNFEEFDNGYWRINEQTIISCEGHVYAESPNNTLVWYAEVNNLVELNNLLLVLKVKKHILI